MLDRPERANALSAELVDALHDELDAAAADGVAVLVLRGNARHFCAGFDLRDLAAETDATLLHRFCRVGLLLERLARAPMPTVAVLEGAAVGAGADVAMACDHRIGTNGTSLRFPGSAFGIVLGIRRLATLVGESEAIRLVTSGRSLDATEAGARGLLRLVGDSDAIDDELRRLRGEVRRVEAATVPAVLAAARGDGHDAALAELVRSLAVRPGLKARVAAYVGTTPVGGGSSPATDPHAAAPAISAS